MIFYFSGTGNSEWATKEIAKNCNDTIHFIPDEYRKFELNELNNKVEYTLKKDESLGFVFPCYSWGVPPVVSKFIEKLNIENVSYLYMVCTCGDDTGLTFEIFKRLTTQRFKMCDLAYSIIMPESYISLPGFDIDTKEKERYKLNAAKERISSICNDINNKVSGKYDVIPGNMAWLKSTIVRPFFYKFLLSPSPFKATSQCISCKKCANDCPLHNITMKKGKPSWGSNCAGCLRCYHICPKHAIEYGPFTKNKGQYINPNT